MIKAALTLKKKLLSIINEEAIIKYTIKDITSIIFSIDTITIVLNDTYKYTITYGLLCKE